MCSVYSRIIVFPCSCQMPNLPSQSFTFVKVSRAERCKFKKWPVFLTMIGVNGFASGKNATDCAARLLGPFPQLLLHKGSSFSPTMIARGFFVEETALPKLEVTRPKMLSCSPTAWTSSLWKSMTGTTGSNEPSLPKKRLSHVFSGAECQIFRIELRKSRECIGRYKLLHRSVGHTESMYVASQHYSICDVRLLDQQVVDHQGCNRVANEYDVIEPFAELLDDLTCDI
jgi:hypothetical protein